MISPSMLAQSIRPLDTVILMHFDSAFVDDSGQRTVAPAGGAAISLAQSKFGGASLRFPNQGTDFVNFLAPASNYHFLGDFTVEGFVYIVSGGEGSMFVIISGANAFAINIDTGTGFFIYLNTPTPVITGGSLSANTWTHVALVRSGSTVTLYVSGTSVGSVTNSGSLGYPQVEMAAIRMGGGATGERFYDDFRISTVARYRANFTNPTVRLEV